jgi:peptidoglycan/LPS O-acetylase OafA/YrhL
MSQTSHYVALDGLRGVAALGIVCYHICGYFQTGFQPGHAYLAVDFFFMLSGFVIAHAYDRRLSAEMGLAGFLTVRLIRLYPLVLLGLALGTCSFLAEAAISHQMTAGTVLLAAATNALLLPSPALTFLRPWAFPLDTPLWSLSFELWINILYAAAFRYLTAARLWAALVLGGGLVVWTSLAFGGLDVGFTWHAFYLGGARVLFPFVMGVLLARGWGGRSEQSGWAHVMWIPLILTLVAPPVLGGYYDIAAVLLVFPVILVCAAQAGPHPRLDAVWRWLGALSYPVYVLHYPCVVTISNLAKLRHLSGAAEDAAALFTLALALALASLAARFYDVPVRRWLMRKVK